MAEAATAPAVSFVVPAYNEERCLPATLASIHAAASAIGIAYEIVVANDASTDATAALAHAGGARVVSVENRQISRTRNAGARAARGERLVFVDADTRVDEGVVRAALAALDAGAVGGGAAAYFDSQAPAYAHRMIRLVCGTMAWLNLAAGCFFYCRRDAFEAAGGWDERHFAGEEIMLSLALRRRGRFVMLPERVLTSPRKFTSRSFGETLWISFKLLAQGMRGVRRRESTSFWYDGRR
jgi:glycosyltransferase involved in cell wall biosynthesis